jgi:prepilin-type N-terminal cleavage/methylation domain-containing protein
MAAQTALVTYYRRQHRSIEMKNLKSQQSGFTLVEIAIVLVIIGLLLGGVLKGQELIANAKVKNLVRDFDGVSTMVFAYQDKYRAWPGDQDQAQLDAAFGTSLPKPRVATPSTAIKNGRIDGDWNTITPTDESYLFWQVVRLANLATGNSDPADTDGNYLPRNADGGRIGVDSGIVAGVTKPWIQGMTGQFYVCADNIQGRYAKQIDTALDDGRTESGSVRAVATGAARDTAAVEASAIVDGSLYIVCKSY